MREAINTQMLILAREARRMNQQDLARQIDMSPTNLSKIERGDIGISPEILQTIAGITGYPPHFFLQPGEIQPDLMGYRKRQKVPQKLLLPIHARINIIRNQISFLASALQVRPPSLPVMEAGIRTQAREAALALRKIWKLKEGPVANLVRLLEEKGIPVIYLDFETERVDSRSILTREGHPVFFVNSRLTADRQRFSLAYELGHLLLHQSGMVPASRDVIHEANAFAASFLMPAGEILDDFKKGIHIPGLAELKKKWRVSMISLLYRADDLGLLTANQKRYLLQQFNSLQIRRREPVELDFPCEKSFLVKNWIAEYQKRNRLGVVETAAVLCLHVDEFLELYY